MKEALIFILLLFFQDIHIKFVPERYLELKKKVLEKNRYTIENNNLIINASDLIQVNAGVETFYFREIFTAVCASEKCYPVRITFYWNLIGDFVGYELPPGEKLTKVDHQPFTQDEYEKLNKALKDAHSKLRYYSIDNLVNDGNKEGEVDGISGATNREILDIVVEGAVYTFHTLWNLANGPVKKKIKSISSANLPREVLFQLLNYKHSDYKIFAIKAIQERGFEDDDFYHTLFHYFVKEEEALANFAINSIPLEILESPVYQTKIEESLKKSDFTKRVILYNVIKKFDSYNLSLIEYLSVLMGKVDDWQKVQILQIISRSGMMNGNIKSEIDKLRKSNNQLILQEIDRIDKR